MRHYDKAHKIAKVIVTTLVVMLLLMGNRFDVVTLDVLAVVAWFWAINPVAYIMETILHFRHKHKKL